MTQINYVTTKPYEGNNQITLVHSKQANGFQNDTWLTFLQAQEVGRKIRKGSKGVALARVLKFEDKKGREETKIRHFTVFNFDQTEQGE